MPRCRPQIASSEQRLHDLQQEHDTAVAQHQTRDADTRSTITRMTAELDSTNAQNDELKEALSARKARVAELEAALRQTEETLVSAQGRIAALDDQLADLTTQNEGLLEEVNTLMVLNSDLVQEGVSKDDAYEEKDTQREETLNDLEAQVKSLTLDLEYEKQRAAAAQDNADNGAKDQLTALQNAHAALQRSHASLKEDHSAMSSEHGELLDEVNDLIGVNRELREEVQELQDALAANVDLAPVATAGLVGLQSLSAGEIRAQELDDDLKGLRRELSQMQATETQLKHDLRQKEHALQTSARELSDVRAAMDALKVSFEAEREDLSEELSKFLQINVDLTQQLNAKSEQGQVASPDTSILPTDTNLQMEADTANTRERIETLERERDTASAALTAAHEANATLQTVLTEKDHKLTAANKETESLMQEVDDLMMFMSEINQELATLKQSRLGLDVVKSGLGLGDNINSEALKADLEETQLQLKKQADEVVFGCIRCS